MKISSAPIFAAILMLASCGTASQYASSDNGQRFQDGIYASAPSVQDREQKEENDKEMQDLVAKTQASEIYLFGEKKDTVMIPENMSAMIRYDQKLGGTVVTVGENPYDWRYDLENNYGYWYPYGSPWHFNVNISPWYWGPSWSYRPWGYYNPYYYGSYWCDPWYYGGWYDPWYYGGYYGGYYAGFYDPWYHPYHHGWYDPYWHHQ